MEDEVREFYNKYGIREWNRLEENTYSKINYLLHMHFIENHLHKGMKILDAGCGAGRYSIEFAKRGCRVTLFDISDGQLKIAEEKIMEANVRDNIDEIVRGDIRDLSHFADGQFDMVVCYGAPLSYVLDHREKAIQEFHRILKKEGSLFVSVNNKWGILKMLLGNQYPDFFSNPKYWYIDKVMNTGDLPKHEKVKQPARHFFDAEELDILLRENGFPSIILGGSPCFSCGNNNSIEDLCKDETAFHTIMQIELATYMKPTMVDNGEFLLVKGLKNNG
jgi:ubiquinone/menaquinone biosynthesis C-methylase UbiE